MDMTQTPTPTAPPADAAETTPLYDLVALKLGSDPREWIRQRRGPEQTTVTTCPTCGSQKTTRPTPWRTVADDLYDATSVRVNHQTIINWAESAPAT